MTCFSLLRPNGPRKGRGTAVKSSLSLLNDTVDELKRQNTFRIREILLKR